MILINFCKFKSRIYYNWTNMHFDNIGGFSYWDFLRLGFFPLGYSPSTVISHERRFILCAYIRAMYLAPKRNILFWLASTPQCGRIWYCLPLRFIMDGITGISMDQLKIAYRKQKLTNISKVHYDQSINFSSIGMWVFISL